MPVGFVRSSEYIIVRSLSEKLLIASASENRSRSVSPIDSQDKECPKMSTKELQEQLVANMKSWQAIEDAAVASTGEIIEKTGHPLIRIVMEIIQADSQRHHQVQQMIIDTFEKESLAITPEDLLEVWDLIEGHIEIERKTVDYANEALAALKGTKMVVVQYSAQGVAGDQEAAGQPRGYQEGDVSLRIS